MTSQIQILIINTSPRKNGNSTFLAQLAADAAGKQMLPVTTEVYSFSGKVFHPCIGCLKCYHNGGNCIWNDDFRILRDKWLKADVVLYVCPVYVTGIPGQLKCFIDRLHNSLFGFFPDSSMRHMKVIGALAQGGDFGGGQELTSMDIMRHAALINSIYIAPDGSYINCSGWADGPDGTELKRKLDEERPDSVIMKKTAESLVKRSCELAFVIKKGMETALPYLERDIKYLAYQKRLEAQKSRKADNAAEETEDLTSDRKEYL